VTADVGRVAQPAGCACPQSPDGLNSARPAIEDGTGSRTDPALIADPAPVLAAITADLRVGAPVEAVSARFHACVADLVRRVCAAARERHGLETVALTGGVFANAVLSAACARGLRQDGFTVLRHRLVPPNDGGLALGQLVIAARTHPQPHP
jgi:hydrogenase maturation protein HypF